MKLPHQVHFVCHQHTHRPLHAAILPPVCTPLLQGGEGGAISHIIHCMEAHRTLHGYSMHCMDTARSKGDWRVKSNVWSPVIAWAYCQWYARWRGGVGDRALYSPDTHCNATSVACSSSYTLIGADNKFAIKLSGQQVLYVHSNQGQHARPYLCMLRGSPISPNSAPWAPR